MVGGRKKKTTLKGMSERPLDPEELVIVKDQHTGRPAVKKAGDVFAATKSTKTEVKHEQIKTDIGTESSGIDIL